MGTGERQVEEEWRIRLRTAADERAGFAGKVRQALLRLHVLHGGAVSSANE